MAELFRGLGEIARGVDVDRGFGHRDRRTGTFTFQNEDLEKASTYLSYAEYAVDDVAAVKRSGK